MERTKADSSHVLAAARLRTARNDKGEDSRRSAAADGSE